MALVGLVWCNVNTLGEAEAYRLETRRELLVGKPKGGRDSRRRRDS